MSEDLKNQPSDQNAADVFTVHRLKLHQALENSAESLRQALMDQQRMYAQFKQGLPHNLQTDGAGETSVMEPITADFVGKAYRQAQEMFDELKRKMIEAQSLSSSPRPGLPEPDEQTSQVTVIGYAATDGIMSQATSHLSAAMKAMVDAMDRRPIAPAPLGALNDPETRGRTRPS